MAWNEPNGGKKNDDHDPWSGKPKKQGAPDLDKLLNDFQKKVADMLGKKDGGSSNVLPPSRSFLFVLVSLVVIVLVIWIFLGFFKVQEAEKAVILRFGHFTKTVGPGLHWIPKFIETEERVDVEQLDAYSFSAKMLTKDENIISVGAAVQYRKADAEAFLFNVTDPVGSLEQATASALRQTVGNMNLDDILTRKRDEVSTKSEKQLKMLMKKYGTGIEILRFTLDVANPPEEVQEAFDDVIKAGQDKERFIQQARAYAAQVTTEVKGQVARILADANAYQEQAILTAQGETIGFLAILPQYRLSPVVTRERLYLSTIENVLNASTKVIVDVNNNNVIYLPLEKMIPAVGSDIARKGAENKNNISTAASPSPLASTSLPSTRSGTPASSLSTATASNPARAALEDGYLSFSQGNRRGYLSQEGQ